MDVGMDAVREHERELVERLGGVADPFAVAFQSHHRLRQLGDHRRVDLTACDHRGVLVRARGLCVGFSGEEIHEHDRRDHGWTVAKREAADAVRRRRLPCQRRQCRLHRKPR